MMPAMRQPTRTAPVRCVCGASMLRLEDADGPYWGHAHRRASDCFERIVELRDEVDVCEWNNIMNTQRLLAAEYLEKAARLGDDLTPEALRRLARELREVPA